MSIEKIENNKLLLAIILRSNFNREGIHFFSPDNFSQQLGYMNRPKNHIITPHVHNLVSREVQYTKEVLFIKSGKVRVDFYDDQKNYIESKILFTGDVILLAFGGHGFEMIEPTEMIEVKQGPYIGESDKTRFDPVAIEKIKIKK